jgi:uncharacterized membrane protein
MVAIAYQEVGVEVVGVRRGGGNPTAQNLAHAREALLLGALLVLLQAADGLLTMWGVDRYGVGVEGNPFLRHLMEQFGHVQILTLVKCVAIMFVGALTYYAKRQVWIRNAMGAVSAIYLFAAILPWTWILFIKPNL